MKLDFSILECMVSDRYKLGDKIYGTRVNDNLKRQRVGRG
jgi:hypothetical protein